MGSDPREMMFRILNDNEDSHRETQSSSAEITMQSFEEVDRPWTLLCLLNSWRVNSMDASGYQNHSDLEENARSCLVPLHDDTCCRRHDAMQHVAVCNTLTMIAHLLRAPEGERMELLQHQSEYDRLFNFGDTPFVEWVNHADVTDDDRQKAPSAEFLDVLRDARLNRWLEPDSDFSQTPSLGTSVGRLLRHRLLDRDILDTASSPPSPVFTFLDVLRALARRVNFGAVPAHEFKEPPPDPDMGVSVAAASDTGSHNASTSGSSAQPMTGPLEGLEETHGLSASQRASVTVSAPRYTTRVLSDEQSEAAVRSTSSATGLELPFSSPQRLSAVDGPTMAQPSYNTSPDLTSNVQNRGEHGLVDVVPASEQLDVLSLPLSADDADQLSGVTPTGNEVWLALGPSSWFGGETVLSNLWDRTIEMYGNETLNAVGVHREANSSRSPVICRNSAWAALLVSAESARLAVERERKVSESLAADGYGSELKFIILKGHPREYDGPS